MKEPITRGIRAGLFVQNNRSWTDQDLADYLGISRQKAIKYRNELSRWYPVSVIREASFDQKNGRLASPALYGLLK